MSRGNKLKGIQRRMAAWCHLGWMSVASLQSKWKLQFLSNYTLLVLKTVIKNIERGDSHGYSIFTLSEKGGVFTSRRHTHLHHLLPLQSLDLFGSSLSLSVAMPQFPIIAVTPAKHLTRLHQRQGVAIRTIWRHQLSYNITCKMMLLPL